MAASPYPHYVWAAGHFLVLLTTAWYFKSYVTFQSAKYAWWYKASFFGTITSYSIVCYKSLGTPQPNVAYFMRALEDENVQYFIMAIIWWFSKPLPLALVPYFVFSLFHALTFIRTNILPKDPVPAGAAAGANGAPPQPTQSALGKTLHKWVKANYDTAMVMVARLEILILIRSITGVFLFQNSLIVPLIYVHFLKVRYAQTPFTRDAVHGSTAILESYVNKEATPPVVKKYYGTAKDLVVKWGNWRGAQPVAPQGAAAGAARR